MLQGDSQETLSRFPGLGANIGSMDGSDGAPTRVLVVDDERNITDLVTMALRYEGFAVESAATARQARQAVLDHHPALIVLMDREGLESQEVAHSNRDRPVIVRRQPPARPPSRFWAVL